MGRRENLRVKDDELAAALAGDGRLVIDGAMGTLLIERGFEEASEHPELLNLTRPDAVTEIHRAYVEAGADISTANTFGANARKLAGEADVSEVCEAGVQCARAAGARYVAADIGPTGALLEPYGELSFEEAYGLFAEQVRAAEQAGADLFFIETMADLLEAKAAVLAVTENSDLPLLATMTFNENGTTLMGTPPGVAAVTLAQLGADVVGMNCSLGPDQVVGIARELNESSPVPVAVQPNAGLPQTADGKTVYAIGAERFAELYEPIVEAGTGFVGSCCGSTPEFTRRLAALVGEKPPAHRGGGFGPCVTSARELVRLDGHAVADLAEVVNPDGAADARALSRAARKCKAAIVGMDLRGLSPEEGAVLVKSVLGKVKKPVWLKSDDADLLERAVRAYAGCPAVGSGEGEASPELRALAHRYGCPLAS